MFLKSCFIPEVSSLGYQVPQADRVIFQEHRTQQDLGSTATHGSTNIFFFKFEIYYIKP